MDNATNNNTLALGIQQRSMEAGVHFSAMDSRMRCMPHTVHLAAIKVCVHTSTVNVSELKWFQLLEGIGAISNADSKKAMSRSGNYQDSAVTPVDRQFDDDAIQQEGDDDDDDDDGLVSAITKVMSFFFSCFDARESN
jgi:hypothetical protein